MFGIILKINTTVRISYYYLLNFDFFTMPHLALCAVLFNNLALRSLELKLALIEYMDCSHKIWCIPEIPLSDGPFITSPIPDRFSLCAVRGPEESQVGCPFDIKLGC